VPQEGGSIGGSGTGVVRVIHFILNDTRQL